MVPPTPHVKVAPFCPHHQSENVSIVYSTKDVSMHNSQQTSHKCPKDRGARQLVHNCHLV
jgi:hypothetical protein